MVRDGFPASRAPDPVRGQGQRQGVRAARRAAGTGARQGRADHGPHGLLTIKAERREEEKGLNRSEFRYGMLHRSVRLPANADEAGIKATYRKGILEVIVPLTAPASSGRRIEVTAGE
ncbi:Hsp20/alpha crystallin family protein [Nucisporomicrobium flavum]|uniref:Hsp20/alpha crystallin family protein n=1 Tax=Nucisporomicrobium flavum TaxID=2785915 RepID=UPI0018F34912|nr:Hsp20/alpha crystallin family protein [Nucisporomicrobium flavum]